MAEVTDAIDPRRRFWIRAALLGGIVVAGVGLLAVLKAGPFEAGALAGGRWGGATPSLSRNAMQVQILDANGRPVPTADVFLLGASNDSPAEAVWKPESGLLTLQLPPGAEPTPRALRITARGYRTQEVRDIVADRRVVLRRGLPVRIHLRDVPREGIPKHIRVLLRVKPAGADPDTAGASEVIDLMDNLGGPNSGPRDMPRGGFGYAVSLTQAHAGVLVPEPGSYHVHWGLIDTRVNTWFSLGKRCGRRIAVRDVAEPQAFALAMTLDDLQETLDGLSESVAHVRK